MGCWISINAYNIITQRWLNVLQNQKLSVNTFLLSGWHRKCLKKYESHTTNMFKIKKKENISTADTKTKSVNCKQEK